LLIEDVLFRKHCFKPTADNLGLPCTLQSTPCEHWTTVKKSFSYTANERRRNWCLSK